MQKTGVKTTIGSVISGWQQMMVIKALGLNPESGIRNRLEGLMKNHKFAASERFGFTEEDFYQAQKFLSWYNIRRYSQAMQTKVASKNTLQQLETFQKLVSQFGLLQDKKNELSKVHEYSRKKRDSVFKLMDFAVNNPENHNQGEIIAALMMRPDLKVTDVEGNQHPFYNTAEKKFSLYKPGTLELEDTFRTPFNERVWERFEETSVEAIDKITNEKVTSRNPHIALLSLIESAIERSQGNYNAKDVSLAQSLTVGRIFMLFKRYLPEHIYQQYGNMNLDIITGTKDYKGAKAVLIEHPIILSLYTLSLLGSSYGGFGLVDGLFGNIVSIITVGGTLPLTLGLATLHLFKHKTGKIHKYAVNEALLACDFTSEFLLRLIESPFITITGGKLRRFHLASKWSKNISQKLRKITSENYISEQDRKVMSENVVELIQKLKMIGVNMALRWLLTVIIEAFSGDDDEDERTKKLKDMEQYFNFIGNTTNNLIRDLDRYSNPTFLIQDAVRMQLLMDIDKMKKFLDDTENYNRKLQPFDFLPNAINITPIPIPRQITDLAKQAIEGESPMYFKDDRQWQLNWWDYATIATEQAAEALNRNQRKSLKKQLINEAIAEIKYYDGDDFSEDLAEKEAEKYANSLLHIGNEYGRGYRDMPNGEYRKETSKEVVERLDYKELIKASKEREKMWGK
jgi:hypothetical protein